MRRSRDGDVQPIARERPAIATSTTQSTNPAGSSYPRLPIWPRVENYGRGDFDAVFDTPAILRLASETGDLPTGHVLYLVDFASRRHPNVDEAELIRLDDAAHAEAAASDGFLLYFRGDVDTGGYCRSFCVWGSMQEGMEAAKKARHRDASERTLDMYASYVVTMREIWLDDSPKGFGVGVTRTYRSDDPIDAIAGH